MGYIVISYITYNRGGMKGKNIFLLLFVIITAVLAVLFVSKIPGVSASGVDINISPNEIVASTTTGVTVSFVVPAEYSAGDTITLTWDSGVTLSDATTSTTDADGDGTADGSVSISGQSYTYTFSAATTQASTSGVSFDMQVSAAKGIYSVAMTDSNGNYGAALIYVEDANDVLVTAVVQPLLSFVIRDASDTSDTNTCDLGVLNTSTVAECSYRLKVATNAVNGYTISMKVDGDLRKAGTGDVPDADDIDPVTEDTTVTAGTEAYGIAFDGGSVTSGATVSEIPDFDDDDTPITSTSPVNMLTSAGNNNPASSGDTTHTSLVTHRAAVDADTNTGNYHQLVTYYVVANF